MRFLAVGSLLTFGAAMFVGAPAFAQDNDGDGVIDSADALPCDATVSAVTFAPAEGVHGRLVFEDTWPKHGDLDFNDVVVAYNYEHRGTTAGTHTILATFDVIALGGVYDNALALRLPVLASSGAQVRKRVDGGAWQALSPSLTDTDLTVVVEPFLRNLFGGLEGQINSLPGQARLPAVRVEVEVTFPTPVTIDTGLAPYDVFIHRSTNPGHEVHRTPYAGTSQMDDTLFGTDHDGSAPGRHFVDEDGLPFVLELPEGTEYPAEGVAISTLFPTVIDFGLSAGASSADFYLYPAANAAYLDVNGQGSPTPAALPSLAVDTSCLADPIPLYSSATWGGGCKWGFNGNVSWYGARAASFSGAGIPGSRYVQFDFGTPTAVSGVAANAWSSHYRRGGWRNFRVLYLDANSVWQTAYSGTHPNASGTHVWSFPMQTARYWRFYMDSVYMTFSTSCGYGQFQGTVQLRNP